MPNCDGFSLPIIGPPKRTGSPGQAPRSAGASFYLTHWLHKNRAPAEASALMVSLCSPESSGPRDKLLVELEHLIPHGNAAPKMRVDLCLTAVRI